MRVRIDPHAGPREAEMPEGPRADARSRARSHLALAIEPGAQCPARTFAHEPVHRVIAERAPSLERVEKSGAEGQHRADGAEDPRMPRAAVRRQGPGVLVVDGARHQAPPPRDLLGGHERTLDAARSQVPHGPRLAGDAEGFEHEPVDDLSCVARPGRPRERFTHQRVAEVAVERREALRRRRSLCVGAARAGRLAQRDRTLDAASRLEERRVESPVCRETRPVGKEEFQRHRLARRAARVRQEGAERRPGVDSGARERRRGQGLGQTRQIEEKVGRATYFGGPSPTCVAACGAARGRVRGDSPSLDSAGQLVRVHRL